MGLFTRHHRWSQPESQSNPSTEVYLFVRCPDASPSTTSTCSLAVSERRRSPRPPQGHESRQKSRNKSRGSLFSLKSSKNSNIDSIPDQDYHRDEPATPPTTVTDIHEFTWLSSTLMVDHREQSFLTQPDHHTDADMSSNPTSSSPQGVLLKILIPYHNPDPHKSLSAQIESALRQSTSPCPTESPSLTSSSSSSSSSPSPSPSPHQQLSNHLQDLTTDISTLLKPLQISTPPILPQPPTFTIPKFTEYARNNLTSFRRDVSLQSGPNTTISTLTTAASSSIHPLNEQEDENPKVRLCDYMAHVNENARLRRYFGHSTIDDDDNNNNRSYGERRAVAHIQTGMGGGWWVSRPGEYESDRSERRRDVYAGLM